MYRWQALTDRTAIGLSVLCALHCLLFPVAIVLLPLVAALAVDGEAFHRAMLLAVVPLGLIALTPGYRRHRRHSNDPAGTAGLRPTGLAAVLGHDTLREWGEMMMTLIGAVVIAGSHLRNVDLCRQLEGQHERSPA